MTETEQLKAISELDGPKLVGLIKRGMWWRQNSGGYTNCECEAGRYTMEEAKKREYIHGDPDDVTIREFYTKPYITSLDAIMPVVKKMVETPNNGHLFILHLWEVCGLQKMRGPLLLSRISTPADFSLQADKIWELFSLPTAAQIAEALLRATGKWKD